jgi:hypothetical protein
MGRPRTEERTRIKVVDVVSDYDLRKVISQKTCLSEISAQFHLGHLDAVVFTNRSLTRFRMVLKIYDTAFLCQPNIDKKEQHSLYLKISEELCLLAKSESLIKIHEIQKRAVEERPEINARIQAAIDAKSKNA